MEEFVVKDRYSLSDFVLLVKLLRDKDRGCPWDKEQTHESIRQNFIEETYEAVDAIDKKDDRLLQEELGDVLLQIALHAEIASEEGKFDIIDVVSGLCDKLVLRHPHIFGNIEVDTKEKVLSNWEDIKRVEKEQKSGADAIDDVPKALPPLMYTEKVQKRAAYVGFDFPSVSYAVSNLEEEVEELKEALDNNDEVFEEIGDVIFSAVSVARLQNLDASLALEKACGRFIERFRLVEKTARENNIDMKNCDFNELSKMWNDAKIALNK